VTRKECTIRFGKRLRELRLKNGNTLQEIAEAVGLRHRQAIEQYEKGRCSPTLYTLIKLADYFNVTLDNLVGKK